MSSALRARRSGLTTTRACFYPQGHVIFIFIFIFIFILFGPNQCCIQSGECRLNVSFFLQSLLPPHPACDEPTSPRSRHNSVDKRLEKRATSLARMCCRLVHTECFGFSASCGSSHRRGWGRQDTPQRVPICLLPRLRRRYRQPCSGGRGGSSASCTATLSKVK
ncbi:hypothetical protein VTK73DRAFT_3773 [Phialemonium thermophilum]|uniref:Uncharacterized protein n=1 Tax=Phialemonium thermophilum TaxID=223376 RepID=A0ABR3VG51_9PEZI